MRRFRSPVIRVLFCERCGRYTMKGFWNGSLVTNVNRRNGWHTLCQKCSRSDPDSADEREREKLEKKIEVLRASVKGMLEGCGFESLDEASE